VTRDESSLDLLAQGSVLGDGLLPPGVQVVVATEEPLVDGVFDWGILSVMAIFQQLQSFSI
jgi:hypothetical protein